MNDTDIFFPLYIGDYQKDTQHLTTEQHGAYMLLLMRFWGARGVVLYEEKQFSAITRSSTSRWRSHLKPTIEKFFAVNDNVWTHKRVAAERDKADKKFIARRENGKKGGRPVKLNETELKAKVKAEPKLPERKSESESESINTNTGASAFETLKEKIQKAYQTGRPLSNYEEGMLLEISNMPDAIKEIGQILTYRDGLTDADRKYFPQSRGKLLEKWSDMVDRSNQRIGPPKPMTDAEILKEALK